MFSIQKIKIWGDSSANTLLIEASDGSYDESRGELIIRRPTMKELKEKGLAALPGGMLVYVDGETHSLAPRAAAAALPRSATAPPPPPRFARRKMRLKPGHSEGVVLNNP